MEKKHYLWYKLICSCVWRNINKEGAAYISNNWVGDNLAFSAYELKKKDAQANAKPTAVDDVAPESTEETNEDLDFDI